MLIVVNIRPDVKIEIKILNTSLDLSPSVSSLFFSRRDSNKSAETKMSPAPATIINPRHIKLIYPAKYFLKVSEFEKVKTPSFKLSELSSTEVASIAATLKANPFSSANFSIADPLSPIIVTVFGSIASKTEGSILFIVEGTKISARARLEANASAPSLVTFVLTPSITTEDGRETEDASVSTFEIVMISLLYCASRI